MDQTVTTCQTEDRRGICKWLMWLLIVQIISMSHVLLRRVVSFGNLEVWLQLIPHACVLWCLVKLRHKHKLYMVATVPLSISIICFLLWRLVFRSAGLFQHFVEIYQIQDPTSILRGVSKVSDFGEFCGIVAFALELLAHSSLTKNADKRISKWWFVLSVAVLVLYILMQVLTLVVSNMLTQGTLNIELYQQIYPLLNLPGNLSEIAYVVLLLLTGRALGKVSETI